MTTDRRDKYINPYATFPIREQRQKGEWDYELEAVYLIDILNFMCDDNKEFDAYEDSLKLYRDRKNIVETAAYRGHEKGLEEGRAEGRGKELKEEHVKGLREGRREQTLAFARQMKANREPIDKIARYTGLTEEEINLL